MIHHRRVFAHLGVIACLGLTLLAGCNKGSQFATAKVSGKVTFNGQPVKGGSVTFAPVKDAAKESNEVGKPASGTVKEDGTFVLTTKEEGDGAVIGKHTITYSPPAAEAPKEGAGHSQAPAKSEYDGLVPKEKEVEVKAGDNDLTIELVKP